MAKQQHYQAGELDRLITISKLDELKNSQGELLGYSPTPVVRELPASLETSAGAENDPSSRETAFNTVAFVIRYRTDIKADMRLTYNGADYDILSITEVPQPRRMWTRITAKTRD